MLSVVAYAFALIAVLGMVALVVSVVVGVMAIGNLWLLLPLALYTLGFWGLAQMVEDM